MSILYNQQIIHMVSTESLFCILLYLHWSARVDFRCLDISDSPFSRVTVIRNRSSYKTAVRSSYITMIAAISHRSQLHLRPTEETTVQSVSHHFLAQYVIRKLPPLSENKKRTIVACQNTEEFTYFSKQEPCLFHRLKISFI